jgi:hypothetical protein
MLRKTPLKKGNATLKRGQLRKVSVRTKENAQEIREKKQERVKNQNEFFMSIWNSLPLDKKRDYETGERIYNPFTTNFHHVLPKELYPQFAFSKWNITLVTWKTHDQWHNYPEKCPKIHKLYLELLSKVDTLVP